MEKKRRQTKKSAFTLSRDKVRTISKGADVVTMESNQGKEKRKKKKKNIIYSAPKTTNPSYIEKKIHMSPFPTNSKVYR